MVGCVNEPMVGNPSNKVGPSSAQEINQVFSMEKLETGLKDKIQNKTEGGEHLWAQIALLW